MLPRGSAKRTSNLLIEDRVLQAMRRLTRAIDVYSRKLRSDIDLTGPQLGCLRQLHRVGAMTQSQLAAEMSLSAATVSGILDRLEARRLVLRKRQTDDKRRVTVMLTAAGQDAISHAPSMLQEDFSRRFRELSPRKQALLERALLDIVQMMEAGDSAGLVAQSRKSARPVSPRRQ